VEGNIFVTEGCVKQKPPCGDLTAPPGNIQIEHAEVENSLPNRSVEASRENQLIGRPWCHSGRSSLEFSLRRSENGPDWARTSDPALIKRML
jgi:hypothetical protein